MNVLELIKNRRTIQSFSGDPVSPEILRNAIDAAIWAPNHKLTKPWLFVEVKPETRKKLADEQVALKQKKAAAPISVVEREAMIKKFLEPATLIIAAIKKSGSTSQLEEDYAAMACAIQNLSLYLWSEGVGTKWGTGALLASSITYEILGLKPEEFKLCGLVWVGKARVTPPKPPRPNIEEIFLSR